MAALFLRPDADQSDGSWLNEASSGTNLFASVDEATTPSDTDYIQSSTTVGDKVRLQISDPGTTVSGPLTVRFRGKRGSGGLPVGVIGRLFESTTQRATWQQAFDDTLTTYTYTLTAPEFASISNFNNLFVEFEYLSIWWLANAAIDLRFNTSQYYDSSAGGDGQAVASYLSCARASTGYAANADGSLVSFGTNILRLTDQGILIEDVRTNVVLQNRDLSNAAWTKSNVTAAKDQTGPDGVANSASSILATAGNGTVLQTTTAASSTRFQSAYVKRITGSGVISMTMDNGSTWTDVTVTSSWTPVTIPAQALTNPTVGFRIVTSGDKIAVDLVQNEAGNFISSPIATTTVAVTRAADSITMIGNLVTLALSATGSLVIETGIFGNTSSANCNLVITDDPGIILNGWQARNGLQAAQANSAGTTVLANLGNSYDYRVNIVRSGYSWQVGGRSVVAAGGTVATDAVTTDNTSGTPYLGARPTENQAFAYYQRLTWWSTRLADATLQGFTNP